MIASGRSGRTLAVLAVLLAACRVEKAPERVDELARYFWRHYSSEPRIIAEAVTALHTAGNADALLGGKHVEGTLTDLLAEDLHGLDIEHVPDPNKARGFFVLMNMPCSLQAAERVTSTRDQPAIHPGVYDEYQREHTLDFEAYDDRQSTELAWETRYRATILGASYNAENRTTMRYVAASPETQGKPIVLARTYQVRPATFMGDHALDQDYEIEVLYPASDGTTMHFFAIWRDIRIGIFSIQDEVTLAVVVAELVKWDQRSAEACQHGLVPP